MLFVMKHPAPTYHFSVDFRPDWQLLTWTMDDTDLAEAELDYEQGKSPDLHQAELYYKLAGCLIPLN